jgi:hypothetical protein
MNVHIVCLVESVGARRSATETKATTVGRVCSATDCAEVRRANVGCSASARPGLDWL